jgi:hypothetical protein
MRSVAIGNFADTVVKNAVLERPTPWPELARTPDFVGFVYKRDPR